MDGTSRDIDIEAREDAERRCDERASALQADAEVVRDKTFEERLLSTRSSAFVGERAREEGLEAAAATTTAASDTAAAEGVEVEAFEEEEAFSPDDLAAAAAALEEARSRLGVVGFSGSLAAAEADGVIVGFGSSSWAATLGVVLLLLLLLLLLLSGSGKLLLRLGRDEKPAPPPAGRAGAVAVKDARGVAAEAEVEGRGALGVMELLPARTLAAEETERETGLGRLTPRDCKGADPKDFAGDSEEVELSMVPFSLL